MSVERLGNYRARNGARWVKLRYGRGGERVWVPERLAANPDRVPMQVVASGQRNAGEIRYRLPGQSWVAFTPTGAGSTSRAAELASLEFASLAVRGGRLG